MFVLMLAALAAAPASTPPRPPVAITVDQATVDEAVRLLDAQGFEEDALRTSELGLEAALAAMTEQFQKMFGDEVPEDLLAQLKEVMRDHAKATMVAKLPSLKVQAARLYAGEFTREELVRLRELSADPVMVKARARNKVLGPKLMMLGIQTMRDAQPELDEKIKRMITDYVSKHGEKPTS